MSAGRLHALISHFSSVMASESVVNSSLPALRLYSVPGTARSPHLTFSACSLGQGSNAMQVVEKREHTNFFGSTLKLVVIMMSSSESLISSWSSMQLE
eukprot:CAMPEP_0175838198 /NCGR_PEP_ID=MMETSP0107_2-20121207/18110_1 /TAXON_ID=195067 ORGANISM="Goniomonas pacifica, Strain CCMP1869" /NCGR_SAMPLE_ID=MMETSP0107_2 /ASSEMBLY_ACC=CAM_ASM_000203 /LENGTH=97 /DNA_ID=CAMNT_0017151767 /DNA_START=133 /DNA_END=426 /DNA_ORIENTATION=-